MAGRTWLPVFGPWDGVRFRAVVGGVDELRCFVKVVDNCQRQTPAECFCGRSEETGKGCLGGDQRCCGRSMPGEEGSDQQSSSDGPRARADETHAASRQDVNEGGNPDRWSRCG
ncbi:hypothetical protein [Salinispora cortesiana]|uniref:hypothetical protein n=1 Tax=Salinispora cortesiana TaxID=1305843 RepID=UPI001FDF4CD8|nr:hypothetical protein [Salinispora cortesiana]